MSAIVSSNAIYLCKKEFSSNYIYDEHLHESYEINYINQGRCMMTIEDKKVTLRQGECIILSPYYAHSFMVDASQKCCITQLSFKLNEVSINLEELMIFKDKQPYFKIASCTDVLESMQSMYTYAHDKSYGTYNKLLLNVELQKLFIILSMHIEQMCLIGPKYEHTILESVLAYIHENYEQDIQLEALAKQHKMSSRYLRKIFMEHVGFNAMEYITMLRIEKAKDLLKNTSKPISHIAFQVGYNSFQYFSMHFKKKTRITPKDFRNQYKMKGIQND